MLRKSVAPRISGATRNSFGGSFRNTPTALNLQVHFLSIAHQVRPEFAVMLANFVFGGIHD